MPEAVSASLTKIRPQNAKIIAYENVFTAIT
jgi:hypothetical protein